MEIGRFSMDVSRRGAQCAQQEPTGSLCSQRHELECRGNYSLSKQAVAMVHKCFMRSEKRHPSSSTRSVPGGSVPPPHTPDRDIDNPPASRASRSRLFASWSNEFPAKFERPRERRPSSRRKSAQWRRYRHHGVPRHPARSRGSARDRSWSTTPRQDTTPPCRGETRSFESSTELLDRAPPRWPRSRACRACRGSPMQNTLGMAEVLSFPVSLCIFGKQNPLPTRKQTT